MVHIAIARSALGRGLMLWTAIGVPLAFSALPLHAEPPVLTEENLAPARPTLSAAPGARGDRPSAPQAVTTPDVKPVANKLLANPEPDTVAPSGNPEQTRAASFSAQSGADFSYAVRAGDSLSSIAALFHVDTAELLRVNHLMPDSVLQIGRLLRVPNPFAAQVRELTRNVEDLSRQLRQARGKIDALEKEVQATDLRGHELVALNRALQHDVRVLPWWRTATVSASVAAGLMLIVMLLTVLEWRRLRTRISALVEANESLRRLDQKYRTLMAKAELRLQQLYGRRRGVELERPESGKMAEEFELDRYSEELRHVLEAELVRLGLAPPGQYKRSRLREILAGSSAPAAVRLGRR